MSSIRTRIGAGGKETHTVQWRSGGVQHGKTFTSIVEARKLKARLDRGQEPDIVVVAPVLKSGTIAAYAPAWLASKQLSDSGRRFYRLALNKYLIPAFPGAMDKITAAMVRNWFRELETTKSGALIRKIRSVASSMWQDAIEEGLVTSNPWRGQKIKQHVAKAKGIMSPETYKLLLKVIDPGYRLLVKTLGETGLRWGEAMRLVPSDIIGNVLHVRKSKNGRPRQVVITPELADALRVELPFRTKNRRPIAYTDFRKWHWLPAMEGTGYTVHDLRHAHASWLLQGGADLLTVRDRLGHSNISITSMYLHSLPDAGQRALSALDRMLAS
jgi:integrase